ncbi:hypothetical protein [Micromonospora sp. URMC 103]|uniref:hypothetical protein n=1 Tax=Micromonospora sp. URMC 103 TaxID=3423406 RepID=UPI003F19D202
MAHTRTHVSITFANPYLVCDLCAQGVTAWHDPAKCGCDGDTYNLPCGHRASTLSICPSWSPVDGCQCLQPHSLVAPKQATRDWGSAIDRYFARELAP